MLRWLADENFNPALRVNTPSVTGLSSATVS